MKEIVPLLFYIGLTILSVYGWVMNIIYISEMNTVTGMLILRVAGIFMPPLGIILGFIH